jgi:hypothetical protein
MHMLAALDLATGRLRPPQYADHAGAAADLSVQPLAGSVGPDLVPQLFRGAGAGQQVGAGCAEVFGHLRELVGDGVEGAQSPQVEDGE